MKNCTTHHNACDCREAAIGKLIAAKDAEIAALKARTGFEYVIDGRDDPATAIKVCRNCGEAQRQEGEEG